MVWEFEVNGKKKPVSDIVREFILKKEESYQGQIVLARQVNLELVGMKPLKVGWEDFFGTPIPVKIAGTLWRELNDLSLDTLWTGQIVLAKNRLTELRDRLKIKGRGQAARVVELILKDPTEPCYIYGLSYKLSPSLDEILDYYAGWENG